MKIQHGQTNVRPSLVNMRQPKITFLNQQDSVVFSGKKDQFIAYIKEKENPISQLIGSSLFLAGSAVLLFGWPVSAPIIYGAGSLVFIGNALRNMVKREKPKPE
jgi:hypothetical protein